MTATQTDLFAPTIAQQFEAWKRQPGDLSAYQTGERKRLQQLVA